MTTEPFPWLQLISLCVSCFSLGSAVGTCVTLWMLGKL